MPEIMPVGCLLCIVGINKVESPGKAGAFEGEMSSC